MPDSSPPHSTHPLHQAPTPSRVDRLSLLADIATRLLMHERPEEIAPEVYGLLAAHLDLDIFLNYLVDDDGRGISLAAADGVPDDTRAAIRHLAFGEAACGTVALTRTPMIAERVQTSDDAVFGVLRDLRVRAYACHPLMARNQLVGTLAFASRVRDRFTDDEVQLMATVANQVAVAIERGRLLLAHAREHEARRSAESTLVRVLQDSDARLRTVLDILPVGVFIADAEGRMLLANRAAARIWGVPPLATRTTDYGQYRGRWTATGRPVAPDEWGLPRAIAGEESLDREIEIEAFDGERRTIVNSALPLRDSAGRVVGGVAVDVDITERKRAEEELKRSEATLAQAGKMANLGAWQIDFIDRDHLNVNPLHWSDQVYRIFGYEPGEVTATNELFFSHVHPEDRDRVASEAGRAAAERRAYGIEHRIVRRDGVERVVFEHADVALNEWGEPQRMIGAVQDITERKRAEEALRQADRRKNEFLATLSHELRNPLAAIRYALELLDAQHGVAASRPREVIGRQLHHLVRLVDDLLDITRIESNKIRLRRRRADLRTIVQQAIEAADAEIRGAAHELEIHVPAEPLWVDGDADRLSQVVTNLLNNAARYTAAGGRVTVAARADGSDVVITVSDNGIGIESSDLARVFEMFAQVGDAGGGLGIGLALVKALVELHDGSVVARSDGPGRGSEFIVRLPSTRQAHRPTEGQRDVAAMVASERRRILIVEDNADAAEMIATWLRLRQHEVAVAADGISALALAASFQPEIGLFDIGLPGISGYELARRVRSNPALRDIYLVAITGWGQDEDRRRAREAGFDAHLTKPAEPETIERVVAEAPVG